MAVGRRRVTRRARWWAAPLIAAAVMASLVSSTVGSQATFTDPSESTTSSVSAAATFGG